MYTKHPAQKLIAFIVSMMLSVPMIAFGQIAEEPAPPETQPAVETADVPLADTPIPDTPAEPVMPDDVPVPDVVTVSTSTDPVQDTASAQEPVTGDVLEGTANPEEATSTDAVEIPVADATSTEPVIEDIPVVEETLVQETPPEIPLPPQEELTVVADTLTPVVETVAENLAPLKDGNDSLDPDFVVSISGKTIPSKKKGIVGTSSLIAPVTTSVDSETGTVTVSGTCAAPYYVVLLFKNQTDYDLDPRSFIVNRAYPCENGSFSYAIDRLPPSLQNGTYYVMIGEQGESGPWSPTTGLTEITINRSVQ